MSDTDELSRLRARVAELERREAMWEQESRLVDAVDDANRTLEAERDAWRASAQSATPGGSEYTDPDDCTARIRRLRDDLHETKCREVRTRRERAVARALLAEIHAAHMEWLDLPDGFPTERLIEAMARTASYASPRSTTARRPSAMTDAPIDPTCMWCGESAPDRVVRHGAWRFHGECYLFDPRQAGSVDG